MSNISIDSIKEYVNSNLSTLLTPSDGDIIDINKLKERSTSISKIISFHKELSSFMEETLSKINLAKTIHHEEINKLTENLNQLQNFSSNSKNTESKWIIAAKNKKKIQKKNENTHISDNNLIYTPPIKDTASYHVSLSKIKITDNFYINAKEVPDFSCVEDNGLLYYIKNANHFAFKISDLMFHGNIGKIFTNSKEPTKIKSCKYKNQCVKPGCEYYHDPLINAESNDLRNFISTSFVYTAPLSTFRSKNKSNRFGSKDNLETDILELTQEDVDRFYDQSMHFILCAIILKKFYKSSSCTEE